jgi:hypothetical protein
MRPFISVTGIDLEELSGIFTGSKSDPEVPFEPHPFKKTATNTTKKTITGINTPSPLKFNKKRHVNISKQLTHLAVIIESLSFFVYLQPWNRKP